MTSAVGRRDLLRAAVGRGPLVRPPLRWDPALVEEAVFVVLRARAEAGEGALLARYRLQGDRVWEQALGPARERAWRRLHQEEFVSLGLASAVEAVVAEFPGVRDGVGEVLVGRAVAAHEEGADLNGDRTAVGIRVRPQRFMNTVELSPFLRHELTHIADMLDPAFAYVREERLTDAPARENLLRDRYRVLWDIWIDGRLTRAGREMVADRAVRYREFSLLYTRFPEQARERAFTSLWEAERLTHGELLEMAREPVTIFKRCGIVLPEAEAAAPFPGSPCPLCDFPTYAWVEVFDGEVIGLIKEDFPRWEPQEGSCERCAECYSALWGEAGSRRRPSEGGPAPLRGEEEGSRC